MKLLTRTFFTLMVSTAAVIPGQSMAEITETFTSESEDAVFESVMSDNELGEMRGGFVNSSLQFSNLSASLNGNTANNTVSGSNSIDTGAFNNVAGLTNIIQNSGHNVIIQSATQINVNFQ